MKELFRWCEMATRGRFRGKDYIMGASAIVGFFAGSFLWAKESTTPNTPAENTRDLDGIMRDSSKYSKKEMTKRIQNGHY